MVHLLRLQCRSSSVHILLVFLFSVHLLLTSSMVEVAFSDARRLVPAEDTGAGAGANNKAAVTADNEQEAAAAAAGIIIRGETTTTEWRRDLIGSRPPRCERVCMSCGHCEAVQVPIVPLPLSQQEKEKEKEKEKARSSAATAAAAAVTQLTAAMFTYRVDGIANYKPLSWKCSCGGIILDP